MFSVRKGHILVDHVPLEVLGLVASPLEAARITDLRMRLARPLPRDEIRQGDLPIHPLAFQMVEEAGFVMALRANHLPVGRGPPRLHISIHLMAEAAEGRGLGEFEDACEKDGKGDEAEDEEDPDPFLMSPNDVLRSIKKVDPEILHGSIKVLD